MTDTLRPIIQPTRLFIEMATQATAIAYMLDALVDKISIRAKGKTIVKDGKFLL